MRSCAYVYKCVVNVTCIINVSQIAKNIFIYFMCRKNACTYYYVAQLRYIIKWCDMWYTHIKFILRYFHLIKMIDDHHEYIWKNLYIYVHTYMLMIIINIFNIIMMFLLLLSLLLSRWLHWWLSECVVDWLTGLDWTLYDRSERTITTMATTNATKLWWWWWWWQ